MKLRFENEAAFSSWYLPLLVNTFIGVISPKAAGFINELSYWLLGATPNNLNVAHVWVQGDAKSQGGSVGAALGFTLDDGKGKDKEGPINEQGQNCSSTI